MLVLGYQQQRLLQRKLLAVESSLTGQRTNQIVFAKESSLLTYSVPNMLHGPVQRITHFFQQHRAI